MTIELHCFGESGNSYKAALALEMSGLDWEPVMADYKTTAVDRKRIGTPSYHQVVQPIYSRATGRWRRYRAHMVTVLPTLLKWAEIHGYSNDPGNR